MIAETMPLFVHLPTKLNLLHLFPADIYLTPSRFYHLIRHTEYTRSVCFTQPELQTPSLNQNSKLSKAKIEESRDALMTTTKIITFTL